MHRGGGSTKRSTSRWRNRLAGARQAFGNVALLRAPHVAIITWAIEMAMYGAEDTGPLYRNVAADRAIVGVAVAPQAALAGHAPVVRQYSKRSRRGKTTLHGMPFCHPFQPDGQPCLPPRPRTHRSGSFQSFLCSYFAPAGVDGEVVDP